MTPAEHYRAAVDLARESDQLARAILNQRSSVDPLNPVSMARLNGSISRVEQLQMRAQTQALLSIAAANLPLTALIGADADPED
ncbi:hypothetical protein PBI_CLUBL_100 [Gordonia phage ClubL]|uniref:Uncharacterized protein n=1 Tax=Gordonia phage ClubL TaxID=1838065 RepID=A0A160DFA1_9CAUD|nr:hypothetical protein BH768_gp107 [Gordonia phage ClubL]ANA86598.1 hypothetical protein PBI_CLUBL_100 [Gordonia phage ClubL]QYC53585.1 hypothetical protein SEA_NORVS_101 [Gordonia phage Norvs]